VSRGTAGRLLLLGASARALARSALASPSTRTRFPEGVVVLDYFGDADLEREPRARVAGVSRDLGLPRTTAGLGRAVLGLAAAGGRWDGMAYAGGLENRPGLLRRLARLAPLLGNDAAAVAAVRDPLRLFPFLESERILHAATPTLDAAPCDGRWLFKRRRGAGGSGVRDAAPGEPRRPGECLQAHLDGAPGSAAFVADGREGRLLGASRQIAGSPARAALGAAAYRYAGNIAGPIGALLDPASHQALQHAVSRITSRFGLRGLNGVDYILTGDGPAVIEVNPRFTASMEILEEIASVSFFDLHLRALDGALPREGSATDGPGAGSPAEAAGWMGKGILYADGAVTAPAPETLETLGVRDRPQCGEPFEAGQPLCTLIVTGRSGEDCLRRLDARAREVRPLFPPAPAESAADRVIGSDPSLSRRTRTPWPLPARPW
jgi:predicted ATP-grasp superfamily ATP-dependent carboligase